MASALAVRRAAAYRNAIGTTRARLVAVVERAWSSLDEIRTEDVERFASLVAPAVAGAQRSVAALTDSHLAALEAAALGIPARPVGVPFELVSSETIRGVSSEVVYARAGVAVWTALAAGVPFTEARERGLERARIAAVTDVQLAKTHAARHVLGERDNVVGYRRVPEANACELCLGASDRRYRTGDLLPIHARCDCDVEPIFGDRDPGPTRDVDLDDAEPFDVHQHDELGPVLTADGDDFTRADDL